MGAIALGVIYQFYYGMGDTLSFHAHGSRHIWEAFMDSPQTGLQIFFSPERYDHNSYSYLSKIWFSEDAKSFFVVRIAFLFDLVTFSSYSGTAVLFAVISFIGGWLLFNTFYPYALAKIKWIAFASLYLPSVLFWGSGLLKDTITLAALGIATYCFHQLLVLRKVKIIEIILLLISLFCLYSIRKFILQAYLPSIFLWTLAVHLKNINLQIIRVLLIPFISVVAMAGSYFAIVVVGDGDKQYSIDKLAMTAKITAYDIRYGWGARMGEGSGYTLGELDGTWQSMLKLAPGAINVTLFRPYLWEVQNPLMIASALESLFILFLTFFFIYKSRGRLFEAIFSPPVLFCFCFAIVFAFAVGVSTFNFGTLARYKIPVIPFYIIGLILLSNGEKKTNG